MKCTLFIVSIILFILTGCNVKVGNYFNGYVDLKHTMYDGNSNIISVDTVRLSISDNAMQFTYDPSGDVIETLIDSEGMQYEKRKSNELYFRINYNVFVPESVTNINIDTFSKVQIAGIETKAVSIKYESFRYVYFYNDDILNIPPAFLSKNKIYFAEYIKFSNSYPLMLRVEHKTGASEMKVIRINPSSEVKIDIPSDYVNAELILR